MFRPWTGHRNTRAWAAGLQLLQASAGPVPFDALRQVMMRAGEIQSQTVSSLMREAKKAGAVSWSGTYQHKLKKDLRRVSLLKPAPGSPGEEWLRVPAGVLTFPAGGPDRAPARAEDDSPARRNLGHSTGAMQGLSRTGAMQGTIEGSYDRPYEGCPLKAPHGGGLAGYRVLRRATWLPEVGAEIVLCDGHGERNQSSGLVEPLHGDREVA